MLVNLRPMFWIVALGVGLLCVTVKAADAPSRPWMNTALSADQRAALVVKAMTQDEKFRLIRVDFGDDENGWPLPVGALHSAGFLPAFSRLGLPALQESDAGLGVAKPRSVGATALPSALATAASFDPQVAYAGAAMIASEAHRKGFNIMLAGGIDLQRDPRTGRNFEYAGEDPLLAGTMVGQAIRGIQSQHVLSTIKHYAINDLETARTTVSSQIDPTAARESDLLAFEIAIETGHPGSVMCSYNLVNTVYACENDWLLNQVLKRDWAYPGFVMSDWGAVHSAGKAALAGLDQESAGDKFDKQVFFDKPLRAAVASGEVPQARIDDMAQRILRSVFAAGVIDHPAMVTPIDYETSRAVSQRAEEAGAVLLRNQQSLLPLSPALKSIAVIGAHADKGVLTGGGSSVVVPPGGSAVNGSLPYNWPGPLVYQRSSPLDAFNRRVHGRAQYSDGLDVAAAAKLAAQSEAAVVFVEQWTAESMDVPDMTLPNHQDALVAAVVRANPRTIVVLETNGPVKMPWLDHSAAVLEAWYPGAAGGEAIARLLFGEVAPSGRLPVTWPRDESQLPRPVIPGAGLDAIGLHPQGQPADTVDYRIEGADVGYRWFQRRGFQPLFPFGHGLTYTQFAYAHLQSHVAHDRLTVTFDVVNRGKRAGVDVPQLYVTLPGGRHTRRLAGWSHVALKAGETRHVEITADWRLLSDYDEAKRQWQQPAGNYRLQLGHSASSFEGDTTVELAARNCPDSGCAAPR
ncbi:glycoside hydrolase family 3 protein [Rhodanobacter sp. L36]|uniref:beta-glucosidase family protein n=1 Tax=Rhodanobacter sp. L36 TaxID=1747221 RepID=UPI0020B15AB7|nr:glycoside hydrolase family 3 protein [Rhodanobacter sp. L36]